MNSKRIISPPEYTKRIQHVFITLISHLLQLNHDIMLYIVIPESDKIA